MLIERMDLRQEKHASRWWTVLNVLLTVGLIGLVAWKYRPLEIEGEEELVSARVLERASGAVGSRLAKPTAATVSSSFSVPAPFDWDIALSSLEKTRIKGVNIEGFQIDGRKGELTLILSFDSYQNLSNYQIDLNKNMKTGACELKSANREPAATSAGKAHIVCNWPTR